MVILHPMVIYASIHSIFSLLNQWYHKIKARSRRGFLMTALLGQKFLMPTFLLNITRPPTSPEGKGGGFPRVIPCETVS